MSKIVEEVVISEEEALELEDSWYRYQSLSELIKSGVSDDLVMARYEKSYANYNRIWTKITKKYLSKDYSSMGPSYNQAADFATRKITITKN
jgi:hypothetical protein